MIVREKVFHIVNNTINSNYIIIIL